MNVPEPKQFDYPVSVIICWKMRGIVRIIRESFHA